MDILKLSMEWAKDEILSSKFFILFGLLFLFGALGFWQMGKTELAKAFITPVGLWHFVVHYWCWIAVFKYNKNSFFRKRSPSE